MKELTYIFIASALVTGIIIIYYYLDWRKPDTNNLHDEIIVRLKNRFYISILILLIAFLGFVLSAIINEISCNARFWYSSLLFSSWFIAKFIIWKYKFNHVGITPVTGYKNLILIWDFVTHWEWLSYKPDYIFIEYENGKGNLQLKISENKQLLTELLVKYKGKIN